MANTSQHIKYSAIENPTNDLARTIHTIPPRKPLPSTAVVRVPTVVDETKALVASFDQVNSKDEDSNPEARTSLPTETLARQSRSGWIPWHLRASVLLSFAIAYTVLVVLLGGLYRYSELHQGLAKFHGRWHYIFRYAPTAVLTLFAALWAQVEYRSKQVAPWQAMARGWSSAEQSLLLDYVSPMNLLVLPQAFKLRHYSVALAISGSILIKLLIIISTGLFISQDKAFLSQSNIPSTAFSVPNEFIDTHVDDLPSLNVQALNESGYPLGTAPKQAFQPFQPPNGISLAQPDVSSIVDTFSSNLSCETGLPGTTFFDNGSGGLNTAAGCNVTWTSDGQELGEGLVILMQPISCESETDNGTSSAESAQRFLICAMNISDVQTDAGGDFGTEGCGVGCSIQADPITCLLCSPSYSIISGNVTLVGQVAQDIDLLDTGMSRQITGLSSWQMGMSVFQSFGATPPANFLGQSFNAENLAWGNANFYSLLQDVNQVTNTTTLFQAETLYSMSENTFQQLAAQVALLHLTSPTNVTEVLVTYQILESRLCIQAKVFIAMEIMLCILILIAIWLALVARQNIVVSRDPGTILGLATILANSQRTFSMLYHQTGDDSIADLKDKFSSYKYKTTTINGENSEAFGIYAHDMETEGRRRPLETSSEIPKMTFQSWIPFPIDFIGRLLLCGMPLAMIVILFTLLSISKRDQGIIGLPLDTSMIHYWWTLLPAGIFTGMAILFNSLNSSIRTLQPFYTLSDRYGNRARNTIYGENYNRLVAPQRLWFAIKNHRLAMIASTIAVICAGMLTIVVNGLFSPQLAISRQSGIIANTTDWFNQTAQSPVGEAYNPDPLIPTRIMYLNASYPQWTYSELALAEIAFEGAIDTVRNNGSATASSSQLSVVVPALRGTMNCSVHPYTSAAVTTVLSGTNATSTFLTVNMTFPEECANDLLSYSPWSYTNDTLSTAWIFDEDNPGYIGYFSPGIFGDSPCPATIGIFAETGVNGVVKDVTILTCLPYVEEIQANATFNVPFFDLISASNGTVPVTPIESTAKYFNNDSYFTFYAVDGIGSGTFDRVLLPVNLSTPNLLAASDGFFQALFQGMDAISDPQNLLGPFNTNNLISAVDHLYRIIMAQSLNNIQGRRVPVSSLDISTVPQPTSGNLTDPNISRLYQSPVATYLLIALFAVLFICAVFVTFTFNAKELLKQNPNSIAGQAELLVGSSFLNRIPIGAEWCSDKELKRNGAFEGMRLKLRWWEAESQGRMQYGIDIDKGAEYAAK